MTKVMVVVVVLLMAGRVRAQSLAEDIQLLVLDYQKLATMKRTLTSMYNAYPELKQGFEQIKSIAEGNFNLHKAFLDALLVVSPIVRDCPKVARIIDNEAALVSEYQSASKNLRTVLFGSTLGYFNSLYGNLLTNSLRNLDELAMVLTDGQLRMSDAERLSAIDRLDRDMSNQLSFLRGFDAKAGILAGQMGVESNDVNTMRTLHGVRN